MTTCTDNPEAAQRITWGRCRSGRRWFWVAINHTTAADNYYANHVPGAADPIPDWRTLYYDGHRLYGWADSEPDALAAVQAAVQTLTSGEPARTSACHGEATATLKEINVAKRAERIAAKPPSKYTDADRIEHLHALRWNSSDDSRYPSAWVRHQFPITRKTPKRIYYSRASVNREGEGFVDRVAIERDGKVRNRGRHWCEADAELYLEPPPIMDYRPAPPDLSELRQEMANAHPDRGGDRDTFQAARRRYLVAKAAATDGKRMESHTS